MRLSFFGAAHEVTGSCHLLEACGKNILIDCGMEQGPDLYENQELPVAPGDVDYILLTHAHIDHSGNIPLLVKKGFSGRQPEKAEVILHGSFAATGKGHGTDRALIAGRDHGDIRVYWCNHGSVSGTSWCV